MLLRPAIFSMIAAVALAGNVHAHPGHAIEVGDSQSLAHYATHPDHLAVWLVTLCAILALVTVIHRGTRRPVPAYARAVKPRQ